MKLNKILLLASCISLAIAGSAFAEKYRLTTYAPPTEGASIHNTYIAETVCEKLTAKFASRYFMLAR